MPNLTPCSALHRLPRGISENLSPSQTYRLAHSVECKLMLSVDREDRNLRFVLGHAFTLDKIMLRIVEIEDGKKAQAEARAPTPTPDAPGTVRFKEPDRSTKREQPATSPQAATDALGSDTSSDDEEDTEGLALSLTSSHHGHSPPSPPGLPDLIPSSDSEEESEDSDLDTSRHGLSDSVLETIIEEPGNEALAELYETVAGCPCHGNEAPVIEKIWEIPQAVLENENRRKSEEKKVLGSYEMKPRRLIRAGKRMAVVRVAA